MQSFNIIIDAIDCSGKSTQVQLLSERLGMIKHKCSAPKTKEEAKLEYEQIVDFMNNNKGHIWDRALFGERCYAPVKRGYFPDYMNDLEKKIFAHNILIVFDAKTETIISRFDKVFLTEEEIPIVMENYRKEFRNSYWPIKVMINIENKSVEEVYNEIVEKIKSLGYNIEASMEANQ